jgi:hypothetical protein
MPTSAFSKLLKMQLVAADLDGNEAAIRAGIARSRFYDISSGRSRPTDVEVQALLGGALTAPRERERLFRDARRDPSGIAWTLWRAGQSAAERKEVTAALSIDRISLTANTRSKRILRSIAARHGERARWDYGYIERYTLPGFTLQFAPKNDTHRFARVDLRRSELDAPRHSIDVFDVLDLTTAALTRVDVAVDLFTNFEHVHVVPSNRRKVRVVSYWGERVETYYLFARPRQIRVYDKSKQLKSKSACTRIEAELRELGLPPHALGRLENPFGRIALVQLSATGSLLNQLLAREARLFGLPAVLAGLRPDEREAFARTTAPALGLPHPRDVFDREWKHAVRTLMRRLGWA